jgi:hypothetical protein
MTPSVERLINDALAMESESALEAGALGFMARAMVQATLPHKQVAGNEFERRNGNYSLSIMAPSSIGLPYGTIPRLLLAWLTTEAVKTKSRELELGDSLSGFMAELDMMPTGGRWGSITRLKDQSRRLFASSITAVYENGPGFAVINQAVADRAQFWWNNKHPEQAGLWKSTVTLSENFFNEVIDRPVPIDMRAIRALKKSPLALDIYSWLTYRMSYLKSPTVIPWAGVAMMLGSSYAELRDFKKAFLNELRKVLLVYPNANVEVLPDGLRIKPSLTHIPINRSKP